MGLLRLFGISMLTVAAVYPTFVLADVAPIDYWSFRGRVSWGLEHPTERVIQTQRDFRKLWADIHTTPGEEGRGVPPAPELDFRKEMIIVIGMGRRSTGGYSIKIHSIRDVGDRVVVSYSTYSPGESCMTTQSITSPVELIRLRKSDKPVTLFATNEIAHCSSNRGQRPNRSFDADTQRRCAASCAREPTPRGAVPLRAGQFQRRTA